MYYVQKICEDIRNILKEKNITYAQLGTYTGLSESTIKRFMCGADDSRRVAEKIADALNFTLVYSKGVYSIEGR